MGYRPYFVARFEYGDVIPGYNWGVERLHEDLITLGIEYSENEQDDTIYIEVSHIFDAKNDVPDTLRGLYDALVEATTTPYAEKYGIVRIDFF